MRFLLFVFLGYFVSSYIECREAPEILTTGLNKDTALSKSNNFYCFENLSYTKFTSI